MITKINGHRLAGLCDESAHVAPIQVVEVHVTRREVLDPNYWPKSDLILLPTERRVRLKSNPDVIATVRCRLYQEGERLWVRADVEGSQWIGEAGGSFVFGLAEQLEAERLALEGL